MESTAPHVMDATKDAVGRIKAKLINAGKQATALRTAAGQQERPFMALLRNHQISEQQFWKCLLGIWMEAQSDALRMGLIKRS